MNKSNPAHEFPLPPLPVIGWWILLGLPALVIVGIALLPSQQQTSMQVARTIAIVALAMMIAVLALRRRSIRLQGSTLKVAATFYSRNIGIEALELDKARIVDLAEHTEFAPSLKLNGYGLPGFKAGHFWLRNRARGFCLLIGDGRVLVLPQRDGKYLLLSPLQPQVLLDELRHVAQADAAR